MVRTIGYLVVFGFCLGLSWLHEKLNTSLEKDYGVVIPSSREKKTKRGEKRKSEKWELFIIERDGLSLQFFSKDPKAWRKNREILPNPHRLQKGQVIWRRVK